MPLVRHCGAVAPSASVSEQCYYKDTSCATTKPSTCAAVSASNDDGVRFCPCRQPTAAETVPATKGTTMAATAATPTNNNNNGGGDGETTTPMAEVPTGTDGGSKTTAVRVYPSVNFYATTGQNACTPGTIKCKCDDSGSCFDDLICYGK